MKTIFENLGGTYIQAGEYMCQILIYPMKMKGKSVFGK